MPLVNMNEMLAYAKEGKYAVGSFDLINMEFAEAIVAGAEKQNAPVIISTAAVHFDYVNMETLAPSLVKLCENAKVPVALHLDHGSSFEMAAQAIRLGFTSVQIDTAHLPLEENIVFTKKIVDMAHAVNVSVEGELGYVSGHEGDHSNREMEDETVYTDPVDAKRFVDETGVDCLAVSIGTVHGLLKGEPRIDINRMKEINDIVGVPLVIHGGSGLSQETYNQMMDAGMAKINFYAELSKVATQSIKDRLANDPDSSNITQILGGVRGAVEELVQEKIKVWRSDNKI